MDLTVQAEHQKEQEKHHSDLHRELLGLQNWNQADGLTQERRMTNYRDSMIQNQRELNATLHLQAREFLPESTAQQTAQGQPVQQVPAEETHKQKRERMRKEKKARKSCPVGTAETYDAVAAIADVKQMKSNSLKPYLAGAREAGVDNRVLSAWLSGHRTNFFGHPASDQDEACFEWDKKFIEAYISKDIQRRKPYLEDFGRELINYPLSVLNLSDSYIRGNVEEVGRITQKAYYYKNMMDDPVNQPYFNSLKPSQRALLTSKLNAFVMLGTQYNRVLGGIGVNTNEGEYLQDEVDIAASREMAELDRADLETSLNDFCTECDEHMEDYVEDLYQEKRLEVIGYYREGEDPEKIERLGIRFTNPVIGYADDEVVKLRNLIEAHPDAYAANKELVDDLYRNVYRGWDVINELNIDMMTTQFIKDSLMSRDAFDEAVRRRANRRGEEEEQGEYTARMRMSVLSDAMKFVLRGDKPGSVVLAVLEELGHGDYVKAYNKKSENDEAM